MLKVEKKQFVTALQGEYSKLDSMIVTHYHGVTVSQMTNLRNSLRNSGAKLKIVKNTLSKLATNETKLSPIASMFSGPVAVIFSENSENSIEALKKIVEFNNSNKNLQIIGGILNSHVMNESELQQIAKLPPLNELRANIIGILQAPAANLVRTLQAPAAGLNRVIQAYSEQK